MARESGWRVEIEGPPAPGAGQTPCRQSAEASLAGRFAARAPAQFGFAVGWLARALAVPQTEPQSTSRSPGRATYCASDETSADHLVDGMRQSKASKGRDYSK